MSLKGKVYFFENIRFKDDVKGDKLIIFLNNGNEKIDCLFLKTTKQTKFYNKIGVNGMGCFSDKNVYVYEGKPFEKKTYIQFNFNSIFIIPCIDILRNCFNGNLKEKGDLPINIYNALIKCFKKSPDYDKSIYDPLLN